MLHGTFWDFDFHQESYLILVIDYSQTDGSKITHAFPPLVLATRYYENYPSHDQNEDVRYRRADETRSSSSSKAKSVILALSAMTCFMLFSGQIAHNAPVKASIPKQEYKKHCYCHKNSCNGALRDRKTWYAHKAQDKRILDNYDRSRSKGEHNRNLEPTLPNVNLDSYSDGNLNRELYPGAKKTLLETVVKHFLIFISNNGMTKKNFTQTIRNEKDDLPAKNCLPASYSEAHGLISPFLIKLERYDACVNDCVLFRLHPDGRDYRELHECPVCKEPRKFNATSQEPRKRFIYMPVGPRLARWFGEINLAKLVQGDALNTTSFLKDFKDGSEYKGWYSKGGVFDGYGAGGVPLGLFTDGLNPNRNDAIQKSVWPILLSWFTLPHEYRSMLGPLMLVGIIPGTGAKEPLSMDPYLDLLVDELLEMTDATLFNAYVNAPTRIKVRILHHVADVPAFNKIFQLSGQTSLRACGFCKETGTYRKDLKKVVHVTNRAFLPNDHKLRKENDMFPDKERYSAPPPTKFVKADERHIRKHYEKISQSQKDRLRKETGLKSTYSLMRQDEHDRANQSSPDAAHSMADLLGTLIELLTSKMAKDKLQRIIQTERNLQRVQEPLVPDSQITMPWLLTKQGVRKADERAASISYPPGYGIKKGDIFSRPWLMPTMDSKIKAAANGILAWCLRDLLGEAVELSLCNLFDTFDQLIQHDYSLDQIPDMCVRTSEALSLIERDLPITIQNITTHILHHVASDIPRFGPVHGRWTFLFERVQCWLSRQAVQHRHQEATIMETYRIYDWCVYMILSGRAGLGPAADPRSTKYRGGVCNMVKVVLEDALDSGNLQDLVPSGKQMQTKLSVLSKENLKTLHSYYQIKYQDNTIDLFDVDPSCHIKHRMTRQDNEKQIVFRSAKGDSSVAKTVASYVVVSTKLGKEIDTLNDVQFGRISYFLDHEFQGDLHTWAAIDVCEDPQVYKTRFWNTSLSVTASALHPLSKLSKPQVVAEENNRLWFVTTQLYLKQDREELLQKHMELGLRK